MPTLRWRHSFLVKGTALLVLVAGLVAFSQYRIYQKERELQISRNERSLVLMQATLENRLEALARDSQLIARSRTLDMHLRSMSPVTLPLVQQELLELAKLRPNYDQVRYLDRFGVEKVRVDRHLGAPVLRKVGLQDKSHRDYVQLGSLQPRNKVAFSKIDLNIENGEIETPIKPMIRAATPVFVDDKQTGLIVLNARADILLRDLQLTLPAGQEMVMLDNQGGWILGGGAKNWEFVNDPEATFAVEKPQVWQSLQNKPAGQFEHEGSCYFYRWHRYSTNRGTSPRWLLAHRKPGQSCSAPVMANITDGATRAGLGLLLSLPLLGLWHRSTRRREELDHRLQTTNSELSLIIEEAGHGLIMVDQNCRVEKMNPEAERLLGWTAQELIGKNLHDTCHIDPDGNVLHAGACPTHQALKFGSTHRGDHGRMRTRSGDVIELSLSVSSYGKQPDRRAVIAIADISSHVALERKLRKLATTDELTGAFNRRSTMDSLAAMIDDDGNNTCVLMLDIDYFKRVNDTWGHAKGDQVLKLFASTIKQELRSPDRLGRIGGEEFIILVADGNQAAALAMAERIRKCVQDMKIPNESGDPLSISTSVGVACHSQGESLKELMARADMAVYEAKSMGRNRVVSAKCGVDESSVE